MMNQLVLVGMLGCALSGAAMGSVDAMDAKVAKDAMAGGKDGPQGESKVVKLRDTYYYLVPEKLYASQPKDAVILDMRDQVLAHVATRFKKDADIEGTARLMDGRVINFAGVKRGDIRWRVIDAAYGLGVANCELEPFKSVAIDPQVVPIGSLIKIAETVGMKLPGGKVHDGYWWATDVGGAIKKDRIDLFVGEGDQGDVLRAQKIHNLQPLTVEIVSPPAPDSCVYQKRRG